MNIFRSRKYKCEYCGLKYKAKHGFTVKISCLDDDTNDPIQIDKRVCNECAKRLDQIKESLDEFRKTNTF